MCFMEIAPKFIFNCRIIYHLLIFFLFTNLVVLSKPTLPKAKLLEFENAEIGYSYTFPKDHSAHKQFASEWWYYTGNLHSARKRNFGYQLTFFRIGTKPNGESIYAAHFALSDISKKKFYFWDRLGRDFLQMAGVKDTLIWNKNWSVLIDENVHYLKAEADDVKIDLTLSQVGMPVIQGKPGEGISRKGDCKSCASHYYSLPNLKTEGKIIIKGEVFSVEGRSWMDHEFGSSQLQENQVGWDWFSLQFNDGSSLMLYRMRQIDGKVSDFSNGTYLSREGKQEYLARQDFYLKPVKYWISPKTKASYPLVWEITIPKLDLGLKVVPQMSNQELQTENSTRVSYWEGAVRVIDRATGRKIGQGYMELTGYAGSLKGKF